MEKVKEAEKALQCLRIEVNSKIANEIQQKVLAAFAELRANATTLSFGNLRSANLDRCKNGFNHPLHSWSVNDWAVAVAGETGEMCNYAKKLKRLYDEIQPEKDRQLSEVDIMVCIGREIADIVIYCDLLAARMGFHLGEVVRAKFNETSAAIKSDITL